MKRTFHTCFWRLHHTKVLALLSNGSRFPSNLKDLGFVVPRFGIAFHHVVGVVRIRVPPPCVFVAVSLPFPRSWQIWVPPMSSPPSAPASLSGSLSI
ncbi:hypothetical protein TIFTF001_025385 [Ficus carica]|uniref:Uncharacterized protein n=1 Tax=Ficus carica TaxID=3494 RepID=A0AA88DFI0_FICCA|nr:hypothetical protein TIFTF001_025385 [Ficus carica]